MKLTMDGTRFPYALKLAILWLATALLSACTTIPPPRSHALQVTDKYGNPAWDSLTECQAARTPGSSADQAVSCASSMAYHYQAVAELTADRSQKYRYGEVALAALSLGLAGFEADIDTLKATGLLAGTAMSIKGTQQLPNRISALQTASDRMQCIVENAGVAKGLMDSVDQLVATTSVQIAALTQRHRSLRQPGLATQTIASLSANNADDRIRSAVLETVTQVEVKATRALTFKEMADSPATDISKAVKDAVSLGESTQTTKRMVQDLPEFGRGSPATDTVMLLIDRTKEFEQALIKLRACPAS
jgi:hypothetical protein